MGQPIPHFHDSQLVIAMESCRNWVERDSFKAVSTINQPQGSSYNDYNKWRQCIFEQISLHGDTNTNYFFQHHQSFLKYAGK